MKDDIRATGNRAAKAVIQKLEGLQRSGLTHLRKPPRIEPGGPAEDAAPSPAIDGQESNVALCKSEPGRVGPEEPGRHAPARIDVDAVALPRLNQPGSPVAPAADPEGRVAALAEVARQVAACTRCAELARTRTQTVFGVGNPYARLVFLGEAPGADEDRRGEPFVGRAGQLLNDMIQKGMGLRRQDVYILNILKCRPPGNRNPERVEAVACRQYLDRQLEIIRPEFICCLGAVAAQNLMDTDTSIGRLRGRMIDFEGFKVVCTYHPAYLLRNPAAKRPTWDDLQLLMAEMGLKAPGK
jgi:uracil-DNA glycosylase family 4